MRTAIICLSLLVLPLGLSSACASRVPATVTLSPPIPIKQGANIFVLASKQRDRIVESLINAGLNASDDWTGSGHSLKVAIGSSRSSTACGSVQNVSYTLTAGGSRFMVIKGRGATGSCEPNIFDDMSKKLASYVGG